jgi:hypothetical protein
MAAPPATSYHDPQQICDYVLLRHADVAKDAESERIYKKWTRLWVVARCQVSPFDSFLSHCKKESQWLKNDRSISKYALSDFTVSLTSTRKHDKVIRLLLPSLTIELSFDSQTKMDLYFKLLSKVSLRYHVDLVRAPEHPEREGDYIIEDCSESYKAWKVLENGRGKLCWDWNLRTIRRIHYHKNVEKLEVEAGRLAETGEGHFFFTGRHAYRLFEAMKTELMARAQQKTHSENKSLPPSLSTNPSNLSRSTSSVSDGKRQGHPLTASTHMQSNGQTSSSSGQKAPLGPRFSHSNGAITTKSSASLEECETSSEDYSPSDNSSSFTGTGGSLHDWTSPSPTPFAGNGMFERTPILPPRISDARPFSPCSTTSSSSSSTSGYNVPKRSCLPPPPTSSSGTPHYMKVKHDEMDGDSDYMTMNPALRKKTPPTAEEAAENEDEEDEEEEEENDEEYVDEEYVESYTDMQSARTDIPADFADQYMRMVPIGGSQIGTLTRSNGGPAHSGRPSSVPPPQPPQLASQFRELKIIESSSNTFPGANREGTKS